MKQTIVVSVLFIVSVIVINGCQKAVSNDVKTGIIKISFLNTVKGIPIQLGTSNYTNPFSEQYTITKFKYYISGTALHASVGTEKEENGYHLIDESNTTSLSFSFVANVDTYQSVSFMLGVDSIRNVSGAQTGALDPLNDMFWTWNSGYIMAKMEGNSPQSTVVNNKVEFHIGGFSGVNNVLKNLTLNFPAGKILEIKEGRTSEIIIEADFDKWWQNPFDLKIADNPVCTTPGSLAKSISANYSKMFTIKDVINN